MRILIIEDEEKMGARDHWRHAHVSIVRGAVVCCSACPFFRPPPTGDSKSAGPREPASRCRLGAQLRDRRRDLWFPTISAVGAAGPTPVGADQLAPRYAAAGVNVNIPIFNGHLFGALRSEAVSLSRR